MAKQSVLFVCTHNSARSQMAEGLMRADHGDHFDVFSAGTEGTFVKPLAIQAMADCGIDISGHTSETIEAYLDRPIDYVVTVCDSAREACPYFPARIAIIHHAFADPSDVVGSDSDKLAAFIRSRDEIRAWINERFDQ